MNHTVPDLDNQGPSIVIGDEDSNTPSHPKIAGTPQPDGSFLTPDGRRLPGNPNDAPPYSQRNRFTTYPGDLEIVSPKEIRNVVASAMKPGADESIQLTQEDEEILDGIWAGAVQRRKTELSRQARSGNPHSIRSCRGDQLGVDHQAAEDSMLTTYIDDENGYSNWVKNHPEGFVVNSFRPPSPKYLRLHRSSCGYINSPLRTNYTRDYSKTCSESEQDLHDWAADTVGGDLNPCRCCKR